jgi:hypothetical protein
VNIVGWLLPASMLLACTERKGRDRWGEVVALAGPDVGSDTMPGDLAEAEEHVDAERRALGKLLWRPGKLGLPPRIAPTELTPRMRVALERFRRWHATGARLAPPPCVHATSRGPPASASFALLARLALAAAEPTAGAPEVRATAALGERLCNRGRNAHEAELGCALLDAIHAWGEDRGVDVRALLADHLPAPGNVLRIIAAEAVCRVKHLERVRDDGASKARAAFAKHTGIAEGSALQRRIEEEIEGTRRVLADAVLGARSLLADRRRFDGFWNETRERVMRTGPVLARAIAGLVFSPTYGPRLEKDAALRRFAGSR